MSSKDGSESGFKSQTEGKVKYFLPLSYLFLNSPYKTEDCMGPSIVKCLESKQCVLASCKEIPCFEKLVSVLS